MQTPTADKVRWTTVDLDLLPDNGNRYEIIEGELLVTRAPHWEHQRVCTKICTELENWSQETGLGEAVSSPGIIFTDADNVIPDVVWISKERLANSLDESGHLTAALELIVEILSPGEDNERRDRSVKLKLYSSQGVREYWIVDHKLQQIQIYRRQQAILTLVETLFAEDDLSSPLLPEFKSCVGSLFSAK